MRTWLFGWMAHKLVLRVPTAFCAGTLFCFYLDDIE
jgi:hypothetical protein